MRPRVVFLWSSIHHIGGITTFLERCVSELPAQGVDAWVVELDPTDTAGAPLHQDDVARVLTVTVRPWRSPFAHHRSVVRMIAACNPHVIVTNNQWGMEYVPTFAGRLPIVDITHVDHPDPAPWSLVDKNAGALSAVVGVSDRIVERLNGLSGCAGKVRSIPYGVSTAYSEREPPDEPVILFVGRLMRRHKRAQDLVPFARALSDHLPRHRLIVIGDGPERTALTEAIGRDHRVEIVGAIPPEAVGAYYERAHYFVQFSEFEGLSIALLEAMGRGVVPVVTRIESGVEQVVRNERTGFLFPVGRPDEAVRRLVESLPLWTDLSRRAFRTIEEGYSLRLMLERYASLFHEAACEPLNEAPAYVDDGYGGPKSWIARRILPIPLYRRLGGIV